jgi:hypothetical protein
MVGGFFSSGADLEHVQVMKNRTIAFGTMDYSEMSGIWETSSFACVCVPGRENADGTAVLAIVAGNMAGCASEASIGEWLKMPKAAIHALVNKQFHGVTTCRSAVPILTSIFANTH